MDHRLAVRVFFNIGCPIIPDGLRGVYSCEQDFILLDTILLRQSRRGSRNSRKKYWIIYPGLAKSV
jgi:hypothetical protein